MLAVAMEVKIMYNNVQKRIILLVFQVIFSCSLKMQESDLRFFLRSEEILPERVNLV